MADPIALAEEILVLTPAAQLRLAADLIERRAQLGVAHAIIERIATEIGAALAMQALDRQTKSGGGK